VPLAGTDYVPGLTEERTLQEVKQLLEQRHYEEAVRDRADIEPLPVVGEPS
jgi:hypothetical protein